VPRGEYGQYGDEATADQVGGEHDLARAQLVGEHAAERDSRGARHAVAGEHDAEQDRAAVRRQHQPWQRDGVATA
jgi:hypothetical protein